MSSDTNIDSKNAVPSDNGLKDEGGFTPLPKRQAIELRTGELLGSGSRVIDDVERQLAIVRSEPGPAPVSGVLRKH